MLARKSRSVESTAPFLDGDRPTLASVAPDWVEMRDRHAGLVARAAEIEAELLRITPIVNRAGLYASNMPGVGFLQPPAPPPSPPNEKVVSLLGRFMPTRKEAEPEALPGDHPEALRQRANELSDELNALREALKLLTPEMERARLAGSAELCRRLAPEYQIVADRVCEAILALGDAALSHEAWLAELRAQGAAFSMLRPVLVQGPDESGDPIVRWRRLLEWAAEAGGWFDPARIPNTWRKR